MSVKEYALLWALFLTGYALIRLIPIFLDDILAAFGYVGKFLVYDVYTRLFPKQFYQLVVIPLKQIHRIDELKMRVYRLIEHILRGPRAHIQAEQGVVYVSSDKEPVAVRYRFDSFRRLFEQYNCRREWEEFWVDTLDTGLGYYSENLFIRLKPFREEILKERICAVPFLPEPCKEFIKSYHGDHAANGNKG